VQSYTGVNSTQQDYTANYSTIIIITELKLSAKISI